MGEALKNVMRSDGRVSEIIRFGLVGGIATVIQYAIYVVFVDVAGVKAVPSTMISYALSFIINYFLSSYFTFHSKPTARNGVGFTMSHLVNMGLQTGLVAIFKGIVGASLALLPALAICIPVNYLMVRFVFKSRIFKSNTTTKRI